MTTTAPANPATDDDLLRQAAAGGPTGRRALGELAARYERALLGLARGILGGREDLAMDAVQETWVRVIRFGGGFSGGSSVKTWLYRIAINQCRNLLAARRWEGLGKGGDGDVDAAGGTRGVAERARRNGLAPGAVAEDQESARALREAVSRLGETKRELVLLCYHAGLTHTEAAAVLEVPVGTLKSRLHAALRELREELAAMEGWAT